MTDTALKEGVEKYVSKTLHTDLRLEPVSDIPSLPPYLTHAYDFYRGHVRDRFLLFMVKTKEGGTPAEWAKHLSAIRGKTQDPPVFVTNAISPHNRSRLIDQAVPFVVPGNQLYLPDLALDLREHFLGARPASPAALAPATQAVLFAHLLGIAANGQTATQMAEHLGYTPMSIGRAFDELEGAQLARTRKSGRERHIQYGADKRALLDLAKPMLRSPVRSKRYVDRDLDGLNLKLAGEAGLSRLSSLGYSGFPIYAATIARWKDIQSTYDISEVEEDQAMNELEIWSYEPSVLSNTWTVDPLSLYAQFRTHPDERVAMAAEDILGAVDWSSV